MAKAKKGDRVRIDYTGTLEDGTVFDSTLEETDCSSDDCTTDECDSADCGCGCESGPFELVIGDGGFFPQIEAALVGMAPGEQKSVKIPAEDAFGEYDEEKVFNVSRSELPAGLTPKIGDQLVLSDENDEEIGVVVVEADDGSVTFDSNHPLAGEELTFQFQLVEIL